MAWTNEKVELAKKLWLERYSAGHIAQQLGAGFTRSSVVGKLNRLGLARKNDGKAPPALLNRTGFVLVRKRNRLLPPERRHDPGPIDMPPSLEVAFKDLRDGQCRWVNDSKRYCGHPSIDGTSYCKAHGAIVYMPVIRKFA